MGRKLDKNSDSMVKKDAKKIIPKISNIFRSERVLRSTTHKYVDPLRVTIKDSKKEEFRVTIAFVYNEEEDDIHRRKELFDIEVDEFAHDHIHHFYDFGDDCHEKLFSFIESFLKEISFESCSELENYKLTQKIVDTMIKHCKDYDLRGL